MWCSAAPEIVGQQNRLGDLALGSPPLPALSLDGEVGLFFADAEVPLQDALRAIEDLARFEPLRQLTVLALEARQLDLGADEETDRGDQLNLGPAVLVRMTMLQVDDGHQPSAAEHRHREKRLVVILGQLVEDLEPRILERVAADRYGLAMLGHPAGEALADAQLEPVDDIAVGILRCAQDELVVARGRR